MEDAFSSRLDDQGARLPTDRTLSAEGIGWARALRKSLLRPWVRFPLHGEVYEAQSDVAVDFMTHWKAPFSEGGEWNPGERHSESVCAFCHRIRIRSLFTRIRWNTTAWSHS